MSDVAGRDVARPAAPAHASGAGDRYVIIVGFGLSGRTAVNTVISHHIAYTVIESNPVTVDRCMPGGLHIIQGDARDPEVLQRAGIDRATEIAVTVPDDGITLAVVEQARKLNPTARIIARCTFVSGGMEATKRGADETVIAEQVVAAEFGRSVGALLER